MIKIIEQKPDKSVVKTVICRNCGVKLEYVPNDLIHNSGNDWSTDHIVCPNCHKSIVINSN